MKYKQLTAADRKAIEVLLNRNCTPTEIAKELGKDPSTICREIKRRSCPNGYFADIAQEDYERKRRRTGCRRKISHSKTQSYIESRIRRGWSPEQISGRMRLEGREDRVCHETIYNWLYTDEYCVEEKLYQYLRFGRKKRQKWRGRKRRTEKIPNRVSIHDRPKVVEKRTEFGHWEADSVVYPNKKAINTMNELLSSYVVITQLERKTAALTGVAMQNVMKSYEVKTVTVDNGTEFMLHEQVTKETGVPYYFCDPYSSWQRGANEQSNMLVRGYMPKRQNIDDVEQEQFDDIARELNTRPRKRLGWYTPAEVYERELAKLNQNQAVALDSRM